MEKSDHEFLRASSFLSVPDRKPGKVDEGGGFTTFLKATSANLLREKHFTTVATISDSPILLELIHSNFQYRFFSWCLG